MNLELIGYPATVFMGIALGLTGGGGSILTVPILVYLFGQGALQATTYSLLLVGLVALWGAVNAYKNGELHVARALTFGIPGVAGVLVSRRIFLPLLPETMSFFGFSITQNSFLLIAFSLLMLLASASMIRASWRIEVPAPLETKGVSHGTMILSGLSVGMLAGFVGAGGGFLIVPALINLGQLNMRQAVGTSLLVIALQSLLGLLGDFSALAEMNWTFFSVIALLAIIGMSIGTVLRKKMPQPKLKLGFGVFVLVMGVFIFIQEIKKGAL